MKNVIILMLFPFSLFGQINIGLGYEMDYINLRQVNEDPMVEYISIAKPWAMSYTGIVVKSEKQVAPKTYLSIHLLYTRLRRSSSFFNIIGFNTLDIDYYRVRATGEYKLGKFIYLGAGLNFNILGDIRQGKYDQNNKYISAVLSKNQKDYGISSTIGYRLKPMELSLTFNQGLNQIKDSESGINLLRIRSFGLAILYNFTLFGKK